jgi:hypothetical protein
MNGPQKEENWQAMNTEIRTLIKNMHAWDIAWAFRCKRYPDGTIKKLKARFCVRGDQQLEGVDYFETYAPVVNWQTVPIMLILNWQTVRIMLILSILIDLQTFQVDCTAAFLHADIGKDPN